MSDKPPPPPVPRPAEPQSRNVTEAAIKIGTTFIQVLPPAFVALAAVNVVFLAGLLWFLNNEATMRNKLLMQVAHEGSLSCGK
jgi:hypothetical protein